MQAIAGVYDNGKLNLNIPAPKNKANVIVIFTEDYVDNSSQNNAEMSTEDALRILNKYAGSIKANVDAKNERLKYLDERYNDFA